MSNAKPKCVKCKKISQHLCTEEGRQTGYCLAHIPKHERSIFKAQKHEHAILNELRKNLYDEDISQENYDIRIPYPGQVRQSSIIYQKSRPDLLIYSKDRKNIVVVEVDEEYHSKPGQADLDSEREAFIREHLSSNDRATVHVVRIIPDEKSSFGVFKIKTKKDKYGNKITIEGEKISPKENFGEMMKIVAWKVTKRLKGSASMHESETKKITSENYDEGRTDSFLAFADRETLKPSYETGKVISPVSSPTAIKNTIKIITDSSTDPENWKITYPRSTFLSSLYESPVNSPSNPASPKESPLSYIGRQAGILPDLPSKSSRNSPKSPSYSPKSPSYHPFRYLPISPPRKTPNDRVKSKLSSEISLSSPRKTIKK